MRVAAARRSVVHTREILGGKVRNASGEDLGRIGDVMLDLHSQIFRYYGYRPYWE